MTEALATLPWVALAGLILSWGLAIYVFFVAPATTTSRLLIAMLFVDGLVMVSGFSNWTALDGFLGLGSRFWGDVHGIADWALVGVYLAFVGAAVQSPLAKPLSGNRARLFLLLTTVALTVLTFVVINRENWVAIVSGMYTFIAVSLTWGFVAALHSWLTAKDRASRSRARAFTVAFGLRDTVWMFVYLSLIAGFNGYIEREHIIFDIVEIAYVWVIMLYVPLVAYGMLRTQLFDIDLRIKRTLKRSTVVAAFVAVFFLISGLAELFLSSLLGNLLGLLCTSALVFFLDPLQRTAERLSDAAMPKTRDTPEYEVFRKLQVYEATLHATMEDGAVPPQKRPVLDSLIESLGIDPTVARRLEEDAVSAT
jgi:hypothetical protein